MRVPDELAREDARRTRTGAEGVAKSLRRWLFSGACQSPEGAYCAWRDARTGRLAFEYPEINGYLLTFAAGLPDLAKSEFAAARRAADWLLRRLARGDLSARSGWDNGAIYTFDLAMIATGLLSFGARFGDDCVDAGMRIIEFLSDEIHAAGRLPVVARGPVASHAGWASEGRAHLLKVVQCFLAVDDLAGTARAELVRPLIEEAGELQQTDGHFATQPNDELTMLHPHCYALEGLWTWGSASGEDWALERARAGVAWLLEQQLASGGFPRFVRIPAGESGPEQLDVTAQVIRLAQLVEGHATNHERSICRLAGLMTDALGCRGHLYAPGSQHENVWVSLFAAQALGLACSVRQVGWKELV
jgi:hypothetical protein